MSLDPRIKKRIDVIYARTTDLPTVGFIGIPVPVVLFYGAPLGLLYWFWRRSLLHKIDCGNIIVDPNEPPPALKPGRTVAELSTVAKVEFIRSHKHSLLIPLYLLIVLLVVIVGFVFYVSANSGDS